MFLIDVFLMTKRVFEKCGNHLPIAISQHRVDSRDGRNGMSNHPEHDNLKF